MTHQQMIDELTHCHEVFKELGRTYNPSILVIRKCEERIGRVVAALSLAKESYPRDEAIWEAAHTIVVCWDDWDGSAQEDEQREQDPGAWIDAMRDQVRAVIEGIVPQSTKEKRG